MDTWWKCALFAPPTVKFSMPKFSRPEKFLAITFHFRRRQNFETSFPEETKGVLVL
jgi:hypothetical protein